MEAEQHVQAKLASLTLAFGKRGRALFGGDVIPGVTSSSRETEPTLRREVGWATLRLDRLVELQ